MYNRYLHTHTNTSLCQLSEHIRGAHLYTRLTRLSRSYLASAHHATFIFLLCVRLAVASTLTHTFVQQNYTISFRACETVTAARSFAQESEREVYSGEWQAQSAGDATRQHATRCIYIPIYTPGAPRSLSHAVMLLVDFPIFPRHKCRAAAAQQAVAPLERTERARIIIVLGI